ncbi:tripartite motif-containing protein 2-like [Crassostrea virginica]
MAKREFEVVPIPQVSLAPDQLSRQFLICNVCNDNYNEDGKHARLLPCLHALCFECLNKTKVDNQLQCPIPTCKLTHQLGDLDKTCPRDNTRRDLMDFVKVKQALSAVWCSVCPSNIATYRCKQCAEFLCGECQSAHKRVNATKGHVLLEIEKLKQSEDLDAFCRQLTCSEHAGNDLKLYCTKDICQKPVCMVCAIFSCKELNHKIESADKVADVKRQYIRAQIASMAKVGKEIQHVINDVKTEQEKVMNLRKTVEDEIDEIFDNMEKIITRGRADLKKTLENCVMAKQDHLKAQERELKRMKSEIEESSKFTEQALAYTNAAAFLQIHQTIMSRLKTLTEQLYEKEPHELATFGFHATGLIAEVQNKVAEMANIWSLSTFTSNCRAEFGDDPEENKSTTIVVKLMDFQKNVPFKSGTLDMANMNVIVKDPTGAETECSTKMKKGSCDELEVTVKPCMTGRHSLDFIVLDRVIVHKEFESKPAAIVRGGIKKDPVSPKIPPKNEGQEPDSPAQGGMQKPDMLFVRERSHRDFSVSKDRKVFKIHRPWESIDLDKSIYNFVGRYKGTFCVNGLQCPGIYRYAIKMNVKIMKPLDKSGLVFELGIARRSAIGRNLVVEGQKFAWSMIGAHHANCDAICLHIAHNNHLLHHEILTSNTAGTTMERLFGFELDTEFGQWKVFDQETEKQICVMEAIDCSESLYPVVAGYNPNRVEVTATIVKFD